MTGLETGPKIPDVHALLVRVSRASGWFAFLGAVSVVIGVLALVWPGHTLVALAVLFGLQLVVSGLFRLVAAVTLSEATGGARALMAILGMLGLVVGLWALRHVDVALSVLALFLAIYWIIDGVVEAFTAIDYPGLPGRGWVVVNALIGVLAGILLLVWPEPTLLVLAIILGAFLVFFGAMQLVIAYGLSRVSIE